MCGWVHRRSRWYNKDAHPFCFVGRALPVAHVITHNESEMRLTLPWSGNTPLTCPPPHPTPFAGTQGSGLTHDEARTHMGLWVVLASPLLLGFDIRKPIDPHTHETLTNPNVLAVHKDTLAKQGRPIQTRSWTYSMPSYPRQQDPALVIAKPLHNRDTAGEAFHQSPPRFAFQSNMVSIATGLQL